MINIKGPILNKNKAQQYVVLICQEIRKVHVLLLLHLPDTVW